MMQELKTAHEIEDGRKRSHRRALAFLFALVAYLVLALTWRPWR